MVQWPIKIILTERTGHARTAPENTKCPKACKGVETMKSKVIVELLALSACMIAVLGCRDKEREQALTEAEQAKKALATVEAQLERAKSEMAFLQEQLDAVTETRDEFEQQLRQLVGDRDSAVAASQIAQAASGRLTAQLSKQTDSTAVLEKEIERLTALVKDQQATITEQDAAIDELTKTIAQIQTITERPVQIVEEKPAEENVEQPEEHLAGQPEEETPDTNEVPEQP
jgi:chromosome segregation ATPase